MKQISKLFILTVFTVSMLTACDTYQIKARLLYDGTEIDKITEAPPTFWFRNEKTNNVPKPTTKYEKSYVKIYGLPTGEYGMSVNIDANPENPGMYPGDYQAWSRFEINKGQKSEFDIDLLKIIHLTSPQDNGTLMRFWDAECEGKIAVRSPVVFSWDIVDADVYYDYQIEKVSCSPYKTLDAIASGTTQTTSLSLPLPPSGPNEFYQMTLRARKNGRSIGLLLTHGGSGHGWDYRFRVK